MFMKGLTYRLINYLGYRIERKRTKEEMWPGYEQYGVKSNLNLFFTSKVYIKELDSQFKNFALLDSDAGFIVTLDSLKIYVESQEEFHILKEVLLSNDYKFLTKKECLLIDIGANIGISSLYFSQFNHVKEIHAFEPVLDTYKQAEFNLSQNEKLAKKIKLYNFGLSNDSRMESFLFNKATKGNTGMRGLLSPTMSKNEFNEQRTVQLENASDVINKVIKDNQNLKVVIKMDCEGAEYDILENLSMSGVLDCIDVLMLEWHDRGSIPVEELLVSRGFTVFSSKLSARAGLIHASKN